MRLLALAALSLFALVLGRAVQGRTSRGRAPDEWFVDWLQPYQPRQYAFEVN